MLGRYVELVAILCGLGNCSSCIGSYLLFR